MSTVYFELVKQFLIIRHDNSIADTNELEFPIDPWGHQSYYFFTAKIENKIK